MVQTKVQMVNPNIKVRQPVAVQRHSLTIILLIFMVYGCKTGSEVKFTQPQPESEKPLSNFNRSIQGVYINTADSLDEMIIENRLIRTRREENSALILEDTIFEIDKYQVLKRLHHNYFLNEQSADNYWRVKMMYIHRDTLVIGEVNPGDSLMRFDFVIREDSTVLRNKSVAENGDVNRDSSVVYNYILDPGKRDLKKMIRSGLFERTGKYVKKQGI